MTVFLGGGVSFYIYTIDLEITDFSQEALDFVEAPVPSPTSDVLAQPRRVENADQLFLMNGEGENVRQITQLGGDNPRWSYDGRVHRGEGARYVPFTYDLRTEEIAPLFAVQPDSLPPFPPLSTQALRQMPGGG